MNLPDADFRDLLTRTAIDIADRITPQPLSSRHIQLREIEAYLTGFTYELFTILRKANPHIEFPLTS